MHKRSLKTFSIFLVSKKTVFPSFLFLTHKESGYFSVSFKQTHFNPQRRPRIPAIHLMFSFGLFKCWLFETFIDICIGFTFFFTVRLLEKIKSPHCYVMFWTSTTFSRTPYTPRNYLLFGRGIMFNGVREKPVNPSYTISIEISFFLKKNLSLFPHSLQCT